jgi:hypothetical protein
MTNAATAPVALVIEHQIKKSDEHGMNNGWQKFCKSSARFPVISAGKFFRRPRPASRIRSSFVFKPKPIQKSG